LSGELVLELAGVVCTFCELFCACRYELITAIEKEWEPGYFFLGRYYDNLLKSLPKTKDTSSLRDKYTVLVVTNYVAALKFGVCVVASVWPFSV
jgi:hypothetical protein